MAVEVLLERGLDVDVVDAGGLTVMEHARRGGRSDVVVKLASYGEEYIITEYCPSTRARQHHVISLFILLRTHCR